MSYGKTVLSLGLVLLISMPLCAATSGMARVVEVVNGNTINVEYRGAKQKIRLLGVATPDPNDKEHPLLQRLGTEATEYLKARTHDGWLYVEFPQGNTPGADGVLDASVYVGVNSAFLNKDVIGEGFGIANRTVQTPYGDELLKAEELAKGSGRGIWGSFEYGDGRKVGAGESRQPLYIGKSGSTGTQPAREVETWILIFY